MYGIYNRLKFLLTMNLLFIPYNLNWYRIDFLNWTFLYLCIHLPLFNFSNSTSIPPSTTSLQSAMSNYTGFPNPSASLSSVSAHAHAASAQAQAAAAACSYSSMLPGAAGEHPGCHQNSCKSCQIILNVTLCNSKLFFFSFNI